VRRSGGGGCGTDQGTVTSVQLLSSTVWGSFLASSREMAGTAPADAPLEVVAAVAPLRSLLLPVLRLLLAALVPRLLLPPLPLPKPAASKQGPSEGPTGEAA
jgi:hypothetical protein